MQKNYKNNRIQKFILSISTMALVFASTMLATTSSVRADQDPALCTDNGGGISLAANRADGTTNIGVGTVTDGEVIKYQATLFAGPFPPNCAFQGGTWTLTTPDGVVHPLGVVPRIGGSGVASHASALISYTVNHANEIVNGTRHINAITSYAGGISHADSSDATTGPTLGASKILNVVHTPTVVTDIHNDANHAVVLTVPVGTTVHDKATVTGEVGGPVPTGTVTFTRFTDLACSIGSTTAGTINLVAGIADPSTAFTTVAAGSLSYKAQYNGDGNYLPAGALCEPLTITKLDSNTHTDVHSAAHGIILSATEGDIVHDNATVTGAGSTTPTGNVSFQLYSDIACTVVNGVPVVAVLDGTGHAETTGIPAVSPAMSYKATYAGDNIYNSSVGICEPLTVIQKGHIIVDKVTNPAGDAQSFAFTTTGVGYSGFSLTDTAAPNDQTLNAGSYSVAETPVAGWTQTGATCLDGETSVNPSSITLVAGHTVTCTFTNTKKGHIIVDKVTVPGGSTQSFTFTATGTGYTGFSLTDAAAPNDQEVVPGSYSVAEGAVAGWDSNGGVCTDQQTPGNITVAPGQTITCTFTNTLQSGHLIVQKTTLPAGDATVFNISASGTGTITGGGAGTITDALDKDYTVTVGTYSVDETVPAGWTKTADTCQNVVVGAGETKTCVITNTKNGHLIVDKITNPSGDPTVFNVSASGSGTITGGAAGTVTDAANKDYEVAPGTYSVAETVPEGWTKTEDNCQNVAVAAGQTVTCTITNVKYGHIIIVKDAVPNDAQDFTFTNDFGNGNSASFSLDDDSENTLSNTKDSVVVAGTYSVSEAAVTGWDQTSAICSDGSPISAIVIGAGETVTCTFVNTLQKGQLIVQKTTVPAGDLTVFNINVTGGTVVGSSAGTITDATDKTFEVAAGTYSVNEKLPKDWKQTSSTCTDVVVAPGETKTCLIVNTKIDDKRMTGGGSVFTAAGMRVTHGFELHCDINVLPNRLQVNWPGDGKGRKAENNFHLETLTSAICTDNPALQAQQPNNTWDTYTGTGTGKLNNVDGATASWVFTDNGEPGKKDSVTITITDQGGNVVLNVTGFLNNGNQQAH